MKSVCSIAMLLLVFFQVSLKPAMLLSWKINQDQITERYCVNKNNPMLHCDGKCYLAKQFRKLEREEQHERSKHPFPTQKLKQADPPFLSVANHFKLDLYVEPKTRTVKSVEKDSRYGFDYHDDCFHPPRYLG